MKLSRRFGRSRWLLPLVFAIAAIAPATVAVQPSSADYIYTKVTTYASDTNCTGGRAEVSHGNGGGYAKADTYSWYAQYGGPWGDVHCARNFARPVNYLITTYDLYKWTGSAWGYCTGWQGWSYNNVATHQWYVWTNFGTQPPCGAGYYGTMQSGYAWNNAWFGGGTWSGYHALPA